MITKLNIDASKVIIGGKASGALKGIGKTLSTEAMLSGYGSISNTELGVVMTHVYDGYETLRSFNAPALAQEAKHSAFAFFRDAIADAAENPIGELGSYHNVANGQDYNLFYEDLLHGHKMIEDDLLTSAPDSIEARLDYSNLDWNDPTARADYLKNIQEYAQQAGLRDHAGFSEGRLSASSNELKILLHTSSKEEYTAYIQQFETAIQEHFNAQLSEARDYARELGYKGSLTDVKAMEKFAATLGPAEKGAMEQLIQMTNGKINKVDQFVLARIAEGHIDIQEVLAGTKGPDGVTRHMLNGVELDDKSLHALAALNVFAHSDAIASSYQNKILESIGGSSELCAFDLNNIKHVNIRCREFEEALTKAGFGAWQPSDGKFNIATKAGKNGVVKGVGLQHMSMKQLRNIDLSKIKDPDVRNALKQYINLREHKETLNAAKQMMQNMKMRITQLARKVLGDSDLSQAIGQIQTQYRNVQYGMKVWAKIGDISKWIGKTSRKLALRKDDKLLKKALEKGGRHQTRYDKRMQSKHSGKARQERFDTKQAKQKAKTKAKNTKKAKAKQAKIKKMKSTKRGARKLTKKAGRAQKKLLKKAGKQGTDLVRNAAHLAKHGAVGTTGTSTAAASSAAASSGAAGSSAAGAGAAGGGASVGVVLIYIIVIALIVCAICQIISGVCDIILSAATEFDNTLLGKMVNWVKDLLDNWTWPWEASNEEKENVLWYTMLKLQNEDASKKQVANAIPVGSEFRGGMSPVKRGTADKGPHEYLSEDDNTYNVSWARPVYTSENIGNWPQADTYYVYTNAETGEPINEFTNIKTCLSMAHAYTYQIETKKHIENFTTYSLGLWNYLNKHEVTAILDMCDGCGTYTYDCNIDWECSKGCESPCKHAGDKKNSAHWESAYYGEAYKNKWIYETSPGAKINISLNNAHKFYIVKGTPTDRTDRGCLQTVHNNTTGVVTVTDLLHLGRDKTTNSPIVKYSAYNSSYGTTNSDNRKTTSSYYGDSHGGPVVWYVDPKAAKACFEKSAGTLVGNVSFNDYNTTYCSSSTSPIYSCNNYEAKDTYKRIETTKYHQDAGSGPVHTQNGYVVSWRTKQYWCPNDNEPHTNERQYYQCQGHSTPVYCQETHPYTYTTSYSYGGGTYYPSGTYTVRATTSASLACSNSHKVENVYLGSGPVGTLPARVTLYVCDGHTNHGTFDDTSKFWYECKNYVTPQYDSYGNIISGGYYVDGYKYLGSFYSCDGYTEVSYQKSSTKLYVCKGHFKCNTHYHCPDHTLTYCRGHISYQIERKSIWVESDAIYKDNWTYTVPGNKFLWFTGDPITYSPQKSPSNSDHKSLARGDWPGWTRENRELMATVYTSDWYAKYGVGLDSFVGGQCSSTEKERIKETFKITEAQIGTQLMQNLDFALDACGQVCYYPGDKAVTGGYDGNKFNTVADKVFDDNKVQRGVHGLDPKYFADWVYRSTHANAEIQELSTALHLNPFSVTANVKAGTPIVNLSDTNHIRTGILIGTFSQNGNLKIRYVGIDTGSQTGGGWVTILTESASGWKYSEKTLS